MTITWHKWGHMEISGEALDLPGSFLWSQKRILCRVNASLVTAATFMVIISEVIFGWYLWFIKYKDLSC